MSNQGRFLLCLVLPIFLAILISGCWDQVGIKDRTIVVGMGIDKIPGNDPILLTIQVVNLPTLKNNSGAGTRGGSSNGTQSEQSSASARGTVIIETSTGQSLSDAIHNFLKSSSRQVIFSHNRIVVLGRELATSGVAAIFDDIMRDYQFRATNWIFIAETTAQEILDTNTELGTVPAKEIDQMMINLTKHALILPMDTNEFILQLKSEGYCSSAPLIQLENSQPDQGRRIKIAKTAILKNNRLNHVLTPTESRDLLWLSDKQKGGSLVFPYHSGKKQQRISVTISDGTTRISPQITAAGILIKIDCTGNALINTMGDLKNNRQTVEQLERRVERILERRVAAVIKTAQLNKTDFLGFARKIHSDHPEVWRRIKRNWDEEFPQIKTVVHFQINLNRFGLVKDPILRTNSGRSQ